MPVKIKSMVCPLCKKQSLVKVKLDDGTVAIRCMEMNCAYEMVDHGNHYPHKERR